MPTEKDVAVIEAADDNEVVTSNGQLENLSSSGAADPAPEVTEDNTPPPSYDAKKHYAVNFSRIVTVAGFKYLPRDTVDFRGSELNSIIEEEGADVIRTAVAR